MNIWHVGNGYVISNTVDAMIAGYDKRRGIDSPGKDENTEV
jgi:hypothetical protein